MDYNLLVLCKLNGLIPYNLFIIRSGRTQHLKRVAPIKIIYTCCNRISKRKYQLMYDAFFTIF